MANWNTAFHTDEMTNTTERIFEQLMTAINDAESYHDLEVINAEMISRKQQFTLDQLDEAKNTLNTKFKSLKR